MIVVVAVAGGRSEQVVQTYGYEHLFTLTNLEKAGLLRRREVKWMDSGSPWGTARR